MVLTDTVERHAGCQSFSPPATRPWKADSMKLWFWCKQLGLSALCHFDTMPWVSKPKQGRVVLLQFQRFQFTVSVHRSGLKGSRTAWQKKHLLEQSHS